MKMDAPENYEVRSFVGSIEVRKKDDGSAIIAGMAAVFDKLSENLGGFREMIKPGAFDDTDMSDVRGLWNHNVDFVLGRNKSETLSVKPNANGLQYEIDLPDTRTILDLVLGPIERGDVDQSSFGFIVGMGNDSWDENDDGVLIRTIHRISKLFDVSPVTFAAYADTTVGARSMQRFIDEREQGIAARVEQEQERAGRGTEIDALDRRAQIAGR